MIQFTNRVWASHDAQYRYVEAQVSQSGRLKEIQIQMNGRCVRDTRVSDSCRNVFFRVEEDKIVETHPGEPRENEEKILILRFRKKAE